MDEFKNRIAAFGGLSLTEVAWAHSAIGQGWDTFSTTNNAAIGSKTISATETSATAVAAVLCALVRKLKLQGII